MKEKEVADIEEEEEEEEEDVSVLVRSQWDSCNAAVEVASLLSYFQIQFRYFVN